MKATEFAFRPSLPLNNDRDEDGEDGPERLVSDAIRGVSFT